MKEFFNHKITLNILFCISYFLLATIGFEWGSLTANATLLWPPSGLTVFACMAFGRKILPGLLLGAIISSKVISLSSPFDNTWQSLVIASVGGCASVLQALLVARLLRTYYQRDFRLSTTASILFTLIVLVSCTLSATLGNFTLWQTGVIDLANALQNWAIWWIGDVIGVLIITPLLLWIYRKQSLYENSQANAFLIFSAGVGLVLLTVAAVGHNEHETQRKNLVHETESLQTNIQANIDLVTRDLSTLQEYFLTNPPSQDQFRNLTEPLLKRNLWLDSFSWLPLTEATQSQRRPSLEINFASAFTLERNANGFDWRSDENRNFPTTFLLRFKKQLDPIHSDIFLRNGAINNKESHTPIINMAAPIFSCSSGRKPECKILNLVTSELNVNSLINSAISKNQLQNLDIKIAVRAQSGELGYWKWDKTYLREITEKEVSFINASTKLKGVVPAISVMDTDWQLMVSPQNISIWFLPNLQQCVVLTIGLAMVILLSAYLQALYRQDQIIIENQAELKQEISNQTQALRAANEWLLKEIAEKRVTQEQLKASETHMRTLLDNIPDPVWFKSPEGAYLSFNKTVANLFNRVEADVIGKTASDYTEEAFEAVIRDYETEVLHSETAVRRELWMHIPTLNEMRLMDTIKVAVRDESQTPIGILSIARDITEHHQLINELEKFKRFAEYASEGFSIMSLKAETLYMNPSIQKMLLSYQSPTHNDFFKYFPQDLHTQWREDIFPSVLLNGYWQGELAALRADGSRFPTKGTFFIIRDDKAQPLYLGEVMIDISEQKQVEASLQLAKETAEDATHAKSRFLANMSHEIRTPLNAVLGYSQLFMADTQLSAQQHERMSSILNAGQRLLHLINDILDLSKIEAGALHFRQDYFDLRQELNDIVSIMRTKAIAKGLVLDYDIQLPATAIVKSDRQKIGQIILNLVGNAIKFTHTGSVSLQVHMDATGILFTITDTGPGIAAQELQLLFAAFRQGKSGEELGGTGLGLVISRHIAENLGGELTLDSEQGKGTRAHLRLPLTIEYNTQLDSTTQVAHAKLTSDSYCKVLVVEDDNASRDVLVNLLQDMGCSVISAINGADGLAQAVLQKPDIIFTDIRMPELSGSDMLRELRKLIDKNDLPVVAVSASSLEHERTFYLGEGFHEFISKPYQFRDIYSALKKFTRVEFISEENNVNETAIVDVEKSNWGNKSELKILQAELQHLKTTLNSGDVNNSKKLFTQHSSQTIGKDAHGKIQGAIRQYDLVLAESFLDELLEEIKQVLNAD
ncbi:MAG: response regulator [Gammaproteobacteria bacterium]|nr:MAG: response regulator [Gammaproteobacteria bacterium]